MTIIHVNFLGAAGPCMLTKGTSLSGKAAASDAGIRRNPLPKVVRQAAGQKRSQQPKAKYSCSVGEVRQHLQMLSHVDSIELAPGLQHYKLPASSDSPRLTLS